MKQKKPKEVDGDRLLFFAFGLIVAYFALFITGFINAIGAVSVYLALIACLAVAGGALALSVRVFLPGSDCRSPMRFSALLISVGLIGFTVYAFFFPMGGAPALISWF